DGIRDFHVTGVQTCALPIYRDLNTLAEGPVLAIHQPDHVLDAMDDWNRRQHGASGLAARVRASTITTAEAERQTIEFLENWIERSEERRVGNEWRSRRRSRR